MVIRTTSNFRRYYKRLPKFVKEKALEKENIFIKTLSIPIGYS